MSAERQTPPSPARFSLKSVCLRLLVVFGIVTAVSGAGAFLFASVLRGQTGPHDTAVLVDIEKGAGLYAIKHQLAQAGVISHPLHLHLVVWLTAPDFTPQAGEYLVPAGASIDAIIALLNAGTVFQRRLTIIEGWRAFDVMRAINDAPALESVLLRPPDEGSVFPDTYYYTKGMDRRELLSRMQRRMELTLAASWAERDAGLPIKTPQELLILASVIEKETALTAERRLVASVFVNRLRRNMRLQSDPTVAYGLSVNQPLQTVLSRSDLQADHKWNTYQRKGLPATPIANPGHAALLAAAHPADSEYLYFVASGRGGHNFAKTLDGHNRNVRIYRRSLAESQPAAEENEGDK